MSVRFVFGRGGSGKSTYLLNEIKKRVQDDETTPVIMLVPEQYTFEMEKRMSRLFKGDKKDKFLRSRVLSFKTMSNIVFSKVGGLTEVNINSSGRAMMTYKAIENVSKELNIFSKSSSQSGFISSISEIISELKQYNISYDTLENISEEIENENLSLKLKDISKIYKEYEEKLHENYIDSQDMLTLLADKLALSGYFKDAYIYIDEFTGFTPNQYRVLKQIFKEAKEVYISLTVDNPQYISYNKSDAFSRTKFTYQKLIKLCKEEGIKLSSSINIDSEKIARFKDFKELLHLEKYYNSYPYKTYNKPTNNIKIKEFNNLYSEIEEIAKEIVSLVRDKGVRYKDITIATRDLNKYDFLVSSIFKEYDIPNFIDKKREAKTNPIIVLIISVLEMKGRRYSYETMFRYLKSGLIGIDNKDINLLENYVLANGIKGKKWFEEVWDYKINHNTFEESEYEKEIKIRVNETKNKAINPIINLQNKLKGKNKVEDICRYIYEFLLEIEIPTSIENIIIDFKEKGELDIANQYSQVWNIVIDIFDQMVEIMGKETISLDKFIKLISLGFDEYDLGLVPPSIDQVLVSSIDRMKNPNTKYLYLVGTIDGVFPLIAKDNGLLSDNDRQSLGQKGIEVDIDSKIKTFEEQYLVYKALTSTRENLIVTYPIADHEGKTLRPSVIISRLKKIFTNIDNKSYLLKEDKNTSEEILSKISKKAPMFNELINEIKEYNDGKEINDLWLDVYRYYATNTDYKNITEKVVSGLSYTNQVEKVEEKKIRKLYENKELSISKLEKYAQCPFAYFVQYGLKAKERKEYSFTAPDLGTFIHNILEKFSIKLIDDKLNWKDIDYSYINKNVSILVDDLVSKIPGYILKSSARYKYLAKRLEKMLIFAISIISEQIKQGSFEPIGYEVNFGGKNEKYPPIKIVLKNGEEINLRGQIDRIDEFENEEGKYIRIVDYKSGKKDLNLTDIYYGLQIQLLVYLDAILSTNEYSNKKINPAAILYSRIDDPIARFDENKDDEKIREDILKTLKMQGLLIKDIDIIKQMDKSLENGEKTTSLIIPANINKDGTLGKNTKGVTYDEFNTIRKYVKDLIKNLCEEMMSGNINILPYKNKEKTSCNFCTYSSICQFDTSLKDNKYKLINKKSDDEIINIMKGEIK